jgi:SAM-dependent methyltransferase
LVLPTGEQNSRQRFRDWYGREYDDVFVEIERAVIGADYGANGYTTRAQVDDIAERLNLSARTRVLDIGTGRGWPALYFAATLGCEVVACDVPVEGLLVGMRRARRDGLDHLVRFVAASGDELPLRKASFDAIVHTDTLCCLHDKLAVLRSCAELLQPACRMAFLTIEPAEGLSAVQLQRAIANGPPEVAVEAPHAQMLATAGFTEIEAVDVTVEFSRTQQAWIDTWRARQSELRSLLGAEALNERDTERQAMRFALDEGMLRRRLYLARRAHIR